jgi:hypothetical protein
MRDSLAKTLALLENRQAYLREPDQVFTAKSCASLAWYDQNSCSWRTYQQSFLTDSEPFSETWPRWGMTAGGSAYAHPMSERRITETGGFYLPTPTTQNGKHGAATEWEKKNRPNHLHVMAAMWTTPSASDATRGGTITEKMTGTSLVQQINTPKYWPTATATAYKGWSPGHNRADTDDRLDHSVEREAFTTGQQTPPMRLSPFWVEWLQGFPIGFTVSKDWVTPKSRSKQQRPTACSEASK